MRSDPGQGSRSSWEAARAFVYDPTRMVLYRSLLNGEVKSLSTFSNITQLEFLGIALISGPCVEGMLLGKLLELSRALGGSIVSTRLVIR